MKQSYSLLQEAVMNLDYLRTYLELIKLGSFSVVAKEMSVSQPAVSFQIQKLEQDLGIRLINRGRRKITMTDAGKRLFAFARTVEAERACLLTDLDHLRQEITGDLNIAASTIPSGYLLPPILGEFMTLHPAVTLQVVTRDSVSVISGLHDGTFDVGFCGIAPPREKGLESCYIAQDEIVLIVFPDHPFSSRQEISFAELEGEPMIHREATSGTRKSLEVLLTKAGLDHSRLAAHLLLSTTQAIVAAVEARAGIAFVSNLSIEKSQKLGLVKQVKVKDLELKRDFYCLYYRKSIASRLQQAFITFVQTKTNSRKLSSDQKS
jgi:DNA-binding transcriptional LysR family regulator